MSKPVEEIVPRERESRGDAPREDMELLFTSFMKNLPGVAYIKDGTGRYTYVNEECEKALRRKRSEWIGKRDDELWPGEIAAELMKNDRRVRVCGLPVQILESIPLGDELHHWLVNKFPIRENETSPVMIGAIAVDITKRKRMEEELREAKRTLEERVRERTTELTILNENLKEEIAERRQARESLLLERDKFMSILQAIPDHVCIIDARYRMEYVNPTGLKEFGAAEGKKCHEYFHDRPEPCPWCKMQAVLRGEAVRSTWTSEKTQRTFAVIETALKNLDGTVSKLSIAHDVTEEKHAEEALRFLSSRLLTSQEEERQRIARELHDSIGSSLSAIKFGLEDLRKHLREGTADPECLEVLIGITQATIDESRRIMTDLRPSALDDLGIVATIEWFCRQFQKIYTPIVVIQDIRLEEEDVPEALKIVLFRVMQEAFHNIAKHGEAQRVSLTLGRAGGKIELHIEDDGRGFDPEAVASARNAGSGFGLTGMKERTELSGGSFSIHSRIGKGTTVRASWPST